MRWYLDVDGVINIVNHPNAADWSDVPWPVDEVQVATVKGFTIRWHPSVVATINDFAAHPDHEVVWLTTWGDYANTHLAEPLGISGPFRVLHSANKMSDYRWWKARALAADGVAGPFVWTDDDLRYSQSLEQDVQRLVDNAPSGSLLLTPESRRGLTPSDLWAIRAAADLNAATVTP